MAVYCYLVHTVCACHQSHQLTLFPLWTQGRVAVVALFKVMWIKKKQTNIPAYFLFLIIFHSLQAQPSTVGIWPLSPVTARGEGWFSYISWPLQMAIV